MSEESTDETEIVYVVPTGIGGGSRNNVHLKSDCHRLTAARRWFEKPRAVVDEDSLCSICTGDHNASGPTDNPHTTRQLLENLNPADVGLPALGERAGQPRTIGDRDD